MAVLNASRVSTKTVVVLGAAYAGRRCAQILSSSLPPDWRLVVIDRNTHFNRESTEDVPSVTDLVRCLCLSPIHCNPISRQQGIRTIHACVRAPSRGYRFWSTHAPNYSYFRVSRACRKDESLDPRQCFFPRFAVRHVHPALGS